MHDIMSEHRVLQAKWWFAKGKKSFLYMRWKFHFKMVTLRVFASFLIQELSITYFWCDFGIVPKR